MIEDADLIALTEADRVRCEERVVAPALVCGDAVSDPAAEAAVECLEPISTMLFHSILIDVRHGHTDGCSFCFSC